MKNKKKYIHCLETKIWAPFKKVFEKHEHELTEPFFIECGMRKARRCKKCGRLYPQ